MRPADFERIDSTAAALAAHRKANGTHKPHDDEVLADDEGDGGGKKPNQSTKIIEFVTSHCDVFHDNNRDVYARVAATGEVYSIDTRVFRDWLSASFYNATGVVARDQSVREAIGTLTGIGRHDGCLADVFIRAAVVDGVYYIDLGVAGSSRAIRVEPGGWSVIDKPPVMFLRPSAMLPLPEPVTGHDIDELWSVANIPATHRLLVLAWLIECLRPDAPYPLLELIGEAGSAKSTTQRVLRRLIDDNQCPLRASPKSVEDIFVGAGVTHVYSLENVSVLSPQMQDALCTLATGGGFATRTLYTNKDETVIQVKRPTVINGIVPVVTAHDLIDRCVTVDLPKIDDKIEEREVIARFEARRPMLFGALLDLFASALQVLPGVSIDKDRRPRLVEFARLGMAVAKVLGMKPEMFLDQFAASRAEAVDRTIEASPAASALVDWLAKSLKSDETMELGELLKTIAPYKPAGNDAAWPQSAKGLGNALRRAAPSLRQIGIHVERVSRTDRGWRYRIRRVSS